MAGNECSLEDRLEIVKLIPQRPPFRFLDEVLELSDSHIVSTYLFTGRESFYHGHFPGDPVMPGCLGLDAMWQLVGFFLAWKGNTGRGRALGAGEIKFTGQILPTAKKVTYQLDLKRIIERKLVMGIADGSVSVDGKVIYTAQDLRVGLFQSVADLGA